MYNEWCTLGRGGGKYDETINCMNEGSVTTNDIDEQE